MKIAVSKIRDKIWQLLKDYFYFQRVSDSPIVLNINRNCIPTQKRALISYMPTGFFKNFGNTNIGRTIQDEIFKMIKIISEFDYCIDLVGCNDVASLEIIKSNKYDLIFGFGEVFYQIVKLQPKAISVLYMTESHPVFSLQEETKRNEYFFARHGTKTPIIRTRSGFFYKPKYLEINYSHIITLGETTPYKPNYEKPFSIFPTGIINPNYVYKEKDHQTAKNNFLWLGSEGAIHKGLDLLIDVFSSRNDIVLHICGLADYERKIIKLNTKNNIIDYGFIDVKSDVFLRIVETCSFIILPSCSEGFSTSITTGMLHGLIPIVTKNIGFDRLSDKAIFLSDYKTDYLDSKLTEIISNSSDSLKIFSKKVYDFAQKNFLVSVFEENFRNIILEIISKND